MAASTSALPPTLNDPEIEKHVEELEKVKSPEEFESKLSKIGFSAQAHESMQNAWRIVNLSNWSVEKKGAKGDLVESKKTEQFGKVYRFTEVGPGIDLSYQVTAGGGRGIIAPRDFVILRCTAPLNKEGQVVTSDPYSYISSGVSVTVPGGQNKVGCWFLKPRTVQTPGGKIETHTVFQWLMCCDLKGKIPQFVLDAAFATVMLDYIVHVRKFAAESKEQGRF
ncbi:hypothetical protein HF086_011759 [Spodoptera exigua]|uniref:START domain-containing protein n=1 Tax=Spodoptera exigua TaxID=7107 RepID=A0A922MHQ7_SPOEX|nr:hypothetical protein HF086_011759 [Spodoptera exigua]